MGKNTAYRVHVEDVEQSVVDNVNIENGAMLRTDSALYMGHNNENVIVYPQNLGATQNLGWARYDDTFYDGGGEGDSGKLVLTDGVEVTLPNNGGNVIRSHASLDFYDISNQKFVGLNENDVYMVTVVYKKSAANANQTHIDFKLTGADDYDRINMALGFYKGNDVTQNSHIMFQYYLDANALANGLTPKIISDGGDSKIWDIIFFVQRTQNAGL
jgi:hypothetical protein